MAVLFQGYGGRGRNLFDGKTLRNGRRRRRRPRPVIKLRQRNKKKKKTTRRPVKPVRGEFLQKRLARPQREPDKHESKEKLIRPQEMERLFLMPSKVRRDDGRFYCAALPNEREKK